MIGEGHVDIMIFLSICLTVSFRKRASLGFPAIKIDNKLFAISLID
jgi:hypothetical protein